MKGLILEMHKAHPSLAAGDPRVREIVSIFTKIRLLLAAQLFLAFVGVVFGLGGVGLALTEVMSASQAFFPWMAFAFIGRLVTFDWSGVLGCVAVGALFSLGAEGVHRRVRRLFQRLDEIDLT